MSDFFSGLLSAITPVRGSGVITEENRSLDSLHGVVLQTSGDLVIRFGDVEQIQLKGEDNILPLIETVVADGLLKIRYKPNISISMHRSLEYTLIVRQLDWVETTSSGDIVLPGLESRRLTLVSKGSGDIESGALKVDVLNTIQQSAGKIELASLDASCLNAAIKGSGNLRIDAGQVQAVELHMNSSGKCEAARLTSKAEPAETLQVDISGSGDAEFGGLHALQSTLRLSSSGNLTVGELKTDQLSVRSSGSGDIKILGGKVNSQHVELSSAGKYLAGDLGSAGSAPECSIRVTGSGNAFPGEIMAEKVVLQLTSSGKATLRRLETQQLHASVKGSGHLSIDQGCVGHLDLHLTSAGGFSADGLQAPDQPVENVNVRVTGSGNARLGGLHAENVLLQTESSGDLKVASLQAASLEVQIKGSGSIKVRGGSVEHANVRITSGGDYQAYDLEAKRAEVRSSGSGNAKVQVTDRLDVAILSSGDVSYRGKPIISYAKDGSGEIRKSSS